MAYREKCTPKFFSVFVLITLIVEENWSHRDMLMGRRKKI